MIKAEIASHQILFLDSFFQMQGQTNNTMLQMPRLSPSQDVKYKSYEFVEGRSKDKVEMIESHFSEFFLYVSNKCSEFDTYVFPRI